MGGVFLAGRILFALIFIASGVTGHLLGARQTIAYARTKGAPLPTLTVPLSGVVMLGGGVLVAFGVYADLGALLLAASALVFALFMHDFWSESDPMQRQNQMAHFSKNIAMVGCGLVIFFAYNHLQGAAPLSFTNPLFGRG